MVRRPRPPPVTGKTPRPLTPTRCTETPAKAPAPDSLKLPPPYLAKLWQLNDQTTRQRPGAANRPAPAPALPRPCHRTPGARRALVEVGRTAAGSGPSGTTCSACRPTPAVVAGAPGRWAARGHRATTATTSTAATTRFAARNDDPEPAVPRRLGYLHHGTPPLLRPLSTSMQPDLPNQHRANRRTQRPTAHTTASHLLCGLPGSSQPTTLRAYGPSGAILLAGGPGRSRLDTSR